MRQALHLALGGQVDLDHAAAGRALDLERLELVLQLLHLLLHGLSLLHDAHEVAHSRLSTDLVVPTSRRPVVVLAGLGGLGAASARPRSRPRVAHVDDLRRRGSAPAPPARAGGPPRRCGARARGLRAARAASARRARRTAPRPSAGRSSRRARARGRSARSRLRALGERELDAALLEAHEPHVALQRALQRDVAPLAGERDHVLEAAQPRRRSCGVPARAAPERAAAGSSPGAASPAAGAAHAAGRRRSRRDRRGPGAARRRDAVLAGSAAGPRPASAGRPRRRGGPAPSRRRRAAARRACTSGIALEQDLPGARQRAHRAARARNRRRATRSASVRRRVLGRPRARASGG